MNRAALELRIDHDAFQLDVLAGRVEEAMNQPFAVWLVGTSALHDVDLDEVVGQEAVFRLTDAASTAWTGVVTEVARLRRERDASVFEVHVAPALWLLTERRNHRAFQAMSEPEVALALLAEWRIEPILRLDVGRFRKRELCVQYGESDFAFLSRMLERAGVSYWFELHAGQSRLVLADAPQAATPVAVLPYRPDAMDAREPYVASIATSRELRPGRYAARDVDFRRASEHQPLVSATGAVSGVEAQLERFHFVPGAFLVDAAGRDTPVADDRLAVRVDEGAARELLDNRLAAKRARAVTYAVETTALELGPGAVFQIADPPSARLSNHRLLVESSIIAAEPNQVLTRVCQVISAEQVVVPRLATRAPRVAGVETATVVGPAGDEIPTDEFGRVRVFFHWDRETQMDERSSAWLQVGSAWAGAGYGVILPPRAGQEVIVEFVGGDPDRPIITGRLYTAEQPVPFRLPENKTQSGWRTSSTGGTGGFNELMFEDKAGEELVRMRAERDLATRVKRDERRTVDNDRRTTVGRDDRRVVGRDRRRTVGQNGRKVVVGSSDGLIVGDTTQAIGSSYRSTVRANRSSFTGASNVTRVEGDDEHTAAENVEEATERLDLTITREGAVESRLTVLPDRVVLATQGGAVVVHGPHLTVEGDVIHLSATHGVYVWAKTVGAVSGTHVELAASGELSMDGTRINLNYQGGAAGALGHLSPATIDEGSSGVIVGGPSLPADVVKVDKAGLEIELANGIIIDGHSVQGMDPHEFVMKTLAELTFIASTPSGKLQLDQIAASGRKVTIGHTPEWNGFAQATDFTKASNGVGSDSTISWNPNYDEGPPGMSPEDRAKMPARVLFHELGHSRHMAQGTLDMTPKGGNWTTEEEFNTISPHSNDKPTEADFMRDIGVPYHRTSHGNTWERNP